MASKEIISKVKEALKGLNSGSEVVEFNEWYSCNIPEDKSLLKIFELEELPSEDSTFLVDMCTNGCYVVRDLYKSLFLVNNDKIIDMVKTFSMHGIISFKRIVECYFKFVHYDEMFEGYSTIDFVLYHLHTTGEYSSITESGGIDSLYLSLGKSLLDYLGIEDYEIDSVNNLFIRNLNIECYNSLLRAISGCSLTKSDLKHLAEVPIQLAKNGAISEGTGCIE